MTIRQYFIILVLFFCIPFSVNPIFAADNTETSTAKSLQLTDSEKAWIKAHPVVTMAFDGDYAPYSFQSQDGKFVGIAADFAHEFARRTCVRLNI